MLHIKKFNFLCWLQITTEIIDTEGFARFYFTFRSSCLCALLDLSRLELWPYTFSVLRKYEASFITHNKTEKIKCPAMRRHRNVSGISYFLKHNKTILIIISASCCFSRSPWEFLHLWPSLFVQNLTYLGSLPWRALWVWHVPCLMGQTQHAHSEILNNQPCGDAGAHSTVRATS